MQTPPRGRSACQPSASAMTRFARAPDQRRSRRLAMQPTPADQHSRAANIARSRRSLSSQTSLAPRALGGGDGLILVASGNGEERGAVLSCKSPWVPASSAPIVQPERDPRWQQPGSMAITRDVRLQPLSAGQSISLVQAQKQILDPLISIEQDPMHPGDPGQAGRSQWRTACPPHCQDSSKH